MNAQEILNNISHTIITDKNEITATYADFKTEGISIWKKIINWILSIKEIPSVIKTQVITLVNDDINNAEKIYAAYKSQILAIINRKEQQIIAAGKQIETTIITDEQSIQNFISKIVVQAKQIETDCKLGPADFILASTQLINKIKAYTDNKAGIDINGIKVVIDDAINDSVILGRTVKSDTEKGIHIIKSATKWAIAEVGSEIEKQFTRIKIKL